jgi:hypothetical protein
VTSAGKNILTGSVDKGKSWIWGNVYGPETGERAEGKFYSASRSRVLVDGSGSFHNAKAPTYAEYAASKVVNVKNVCDFPVKGDGVTDELVAVPFPHRGQLRYKLLTQGHVAPPIYNTSLTRQPARKSSSSHMEPISSVIRSTSPPVAGESFNSALCPQISLIDNKF